MNIKSLVIFFSLLCLTLLIAFVWQIQIRVKRYESIPFLIVFYAKFFFIMFLLNDRFFTKQRKKWTCFIFGAVAGIIVGSILWTDTAMLFEYTRIPFFNTLNKVGIWNFAIGIITVSSVGTLHFLIGILSALTSRFFIEKYHLLQGTQIQGEK